MVRGLGRAIVRNHAGANQIRARQDAEGNGLASKCGGILATLQGRKGTGAFSATGTAKTFKRCGSSGDGEDPRNVEAETAEQGLGISNS